MRFLLLFVAAVVAIFAGMAALQMSSKAPAPSAEMAAPEQAKSVATVDVLVARSPIAAGTMVTQTMIDTQPWPQNLVLKDFIVSGSANANIVGRVTRSSLQAREPFIASKLANTNEAGFLAARLPAGMRAVTIATDAVSGVAGFVYPGDRVDLILTHNIPYQLRGSKDTDTHPGGDKPAFSEVLVANAQVLAVNLREANAKEDEHAPPAIVTPSSITLEVNAADAENVRLAEKTGTLSLSLRSIYDIENADVAHPANVGGLTHVPVSEAADDTVEVTRR